MRLSGILAVWQVWLPPCLPTAINMIPKKILKKLLNKKCCICGSKLVQFHHVFCYGRSHIQEEWAIQPLCVKHHDACTPNKNTYNQSIREQVEYISLQKATLADLAKYNKKNWGQIIKYYEYKFKDK